MNKQSLPENVLEFIKKNRLAVMATVSAQNTPEAALVYYGSDEHLHIYCCTFRKSRKFQNITTNNKVALVIGQEVDSIVLQVEGVVRIVSEKVEKAQVMEKYAKSANANPDSIYFPPLVTLASDNAMEFLEITIEWFKFSIFESQYPNIVEGKPYEWKSYPLR